MRCARDPLGVREARLPERGRLPRELLGADLRVGAEHRARRSPRSRIVFARTDTLAGWHAAELVTLLGVYFVVYGAIHIVIAPSLTKFMEDVRTGALDFTLIKPADAQLLVSLSEVRVWKLVDLGLGLAILGWRTRAHLGRHRPARRRSASLVALVAGARHRLRLLDAARDLRVLVRAARERADDLLEHVPGGALAGRRSTRAGCAGR